MYNCPWEFGNSKWSFRVSCLPLHGLFSPGRYPGIPVQLHRYDPSVFIHCPGQLCMPAKHSSSSKKDKQKE